VANSSQTDASAYHRLEHELGVLNRRARGVSGAMARTIHPDLDSAAYGLMVRIDEGGSARVTDLAEYFNVGKPTVSRQTALLTQLGLVDRDRQVDDARSRPLKLTDAGRQVLQTARLARREVLGRRLDTWPPADVLLFAELLHRYNDSI
jgi:DNA-binding MarR family transcriptional regulator